MNKKTSEKKGDKQEIPSKHKTTKKASEKQVKDEHSKSEQKEINLDYKDQYLRIYAEFENFKKRSQKERSEWIQMAGKDILLAMVEVVDDCERANEELLKLEPNEASIKKNQEGIQLIFTKLKTKLGNFGIKPISTEGKDFDINEHEAVTEIADKDKKGKIIAEVQKGYTMHEKVIRYAKVVVGK